MSRSPPSRPFVRSSPRAAQVGADRLERAFESEIERRQQQVSRPLLCSPGQNLAVEEEEDHLLPPPRPVAMNQSEVSIRIKGALRRAEPSN